MTGKWIGQYTYGDTYPEPIKGTSINFNIECLDLDGVISGNFTDDETKDVFNTPGTFNGFIDNNFISFIKKYPCYWDIIENGEIRTIEDFPSQEIHYSGNLIDGHFEGDWEMSVTYKFEDGHTEQYDSSGTWKMFKN